MTDEQADWLARRIVATIRYTATGHEWTRALTPLEFTAANDTYVRLANTARVSVEQFLELYAESPLLRFTPPLPAFEPDLARDPAVARRIWQTARDQERARLAGDPEPTRPPPIWTTR